MTTPTTPPSLPVPSGRPPPVQYGGPVAGAAYAGDPPADAGPLNSLDPLRLLHIARKKWLTLMLAVLFALGAAMFYLSTTTKIYQSRALIELSARRPRILNKQDALIEDPSAAMQSEDTLNTQIEKFKSRTMLPHVVACYREKYPEEKISDQELTYRLQGRANFAMLRHTRLVLVTVQSDDPEFVVKACDAFAAGAEASARAENRSVSDSAVAWLEAQATAQKSKLEEADKELLDARLKDKLDVLEGQR